MNIPEPYLLLDLRNQQEFKGITIRGFKRQDVIQAYQNSMINGKLEDSLKWGVELLSTGLIQNIWESIYMVYFKYIHIHHSYFFLYLQKRRIEFEKYMEKYPHKNYEIFIRNDLEIRHLVAELTCICTLTKKNNMFLPKSLPKVTKNYYTKEDIQQRMIASSLDKIYDFIYIQYDSDMKLALNEILYQLNTKRGGYSSCIYWYMWIEKVEQSKRKENILPPTIETKDLQPVPNVSSEYWDLWIWSLWNIILYTVRDSSTHKKKFIYRLYDEYKNDFKPSQMNKKRYFVYMAFYICKNKIDWTTTLYHSQHEYLYVQSCGNINVLFHEIKKHIEERLSYEEKTTLYDQYYQLCSRYDYEDENENVHTKEVSDPEVIRETYINQIEYTNYPDMKPLTKVHKDPVQIEYVHMIEEQARKVENEIEREIEKGLRTRRIQNNQGEKIKSRVQKMRKHVEDEDVDGEDENKNRKLELYSQFISYKNNSENSNENRNKKYHDDDESNHHPGEIIKRIDLSHKKYRKKKKRRDRDEDNMSELSDDDDE